MSAKSSEMRIISHVDQIFVHDLTSLAFGVSHKTRAVAVSSVTRPGPGFVVLKGSNCHSFPLLWSRNTCISRGKCTNFDSQHTKETACFCVSAKGHGAASFFKGDSSTGGWAGNPSSEQ